MDELDIAAVTAHDALTNRKSQSSAISTIGQERFKDGGLDCQWDAGTTILYSKGGHFRFCLSADIDAPSVRHRLDGIEDEVEGNLLNLPLMHIDKNGGGMRRVLQTNLLLLQLMAYQAQGIFQ